VSRMERPREPAAVERPRSGGMPRLLKAILLLLLAGMIAIAAVRLFASADGKGAPGGRPEATSPAPAPAPAPAPFVAGAADDCASPATDSARAVCIALRAARGEGGMGARVAEVARQGDLTCVRTAPVDPAAGGGTTVRVDREGRIRGLVLTDSAGSCADLPPAGKDPANRLEINRVPSVADR